VLAEGFMFEGVRVPLLGPQGIFKRQVMIRDELENGHDYYALARLFRG